MSSDETENRPGFHLNLSPDMSLRREQQQKPLGQVLRTVESVPVPGFFEGNTSVFLHSQREGIRTGTHRMIRYLVLGNTGVGKTTLLQEFGHWLYSGIDNEDTDALMLDETLHMLFSIDDWGAYFNYIPEGVFMPDTVDYHSSPELLRLKREEIAIVTNMWAATNAASAGGLSFMKHLGPEISGTLQKQVVFGDHVGPTGAGFQVGVDRGTRELYNMIHKKGLFSGADIEVRIIVVASGIKELTRKRRDEMRTKKAGVNFVVDNAMTEKEAREKYMQEAATPLEIQLVDEDIRQYREHRASFAGISLDLPDEEQQIQFMVDYIKNVLQAPADVLERSIVLRNNTFIPRLNVPNFLTHRPLDDALPMLQRIIPDLLRQRRCLNRLRG